jgi:PTS system beta-glucosides-specific IIC component
MFDKLKSMFQEQKGQGLRVLAPIQGECVALAEVPDPTFGEGLLGDGVAIHPAKGRVVSPVNGTVALMFETGHAVSLMSDDGVEVLIHVGLDTVKLKGQHFTVRVKTGDKVNTGEVLLEFDQAAIAAAGYNTITPVVITNMDNFSSLDKHTGKQVQELDEVIAVRGK